jgi:hypothetical protein
MRVISVELNVVSFMAAGHRFAVEAENVHAQLARGEYPTALAVEDLLGVKRKFCSDSYSDPALSRILLIKHMSGEVAVRVTEPVQFHCLAMKDIHPLPAMIASCCSMIGVRAMAFTPQGLMILAKLVLPSA